MSASTLNSGSPQLLQILVSEADAVRRFIDLLQLEQVALKSGKTDALPDLADSKTLIAASLSQFSAQRNTLLSDNGLAHDRPGMDAWCVKHANEKRIPEAWAEILTLAREARELNRLNGELIAIQLQYNSKALEALRGGNSALELYGRDGQTQITGSRRINDAA